MYLFFRKRDGKEKEREKNINQLPLAHPPTMDLARNPGTCPDQGLNQRPFGLWDDTQPTEPHHQGGTELLMKRQELDNF